ncbi:LysR substrate-binding domain-containing protein [Sphingobium algorifonticola]|uniref:LysR family transcriptional regulator n=1 Tax=Sphingobium algorifonticola TaxID=2008318 RepID=A0A437JBA6_9SPHN|nr:LysR substrate-binding domain-containing protein [Sphingobium algorifonticola]RVT43165.1 LysR family transcriptional regulator [Sphingobium algorifonticola]
MQTLPPLAAVRVFEAAARLENFTAAAQELGMTQAAVSYQIKALEDRLGVSLFQRTGRRIALTDKGQALSPVISRAFDDMRSGFAALAGEDASVLTISTTNSFATLWLAPRIGAFQMRHPDLAVRLHMSDSWVDFARDGVDIAIRGGRAGSWPDLDCREIMVNRIAPMCSPAFLAQHGPFSSAAELHHQPRMTPDDIWWHDWFTQMGAPLSGDVPRGGISLDSQAMEGRLAIAGQGIAILSVRLWQAEIRAGLLVEAMPSQVLHPMRYWIVHPPHNRNVPKVKAFRDWLATTFASEEAAHAL